MKTILFSVLLLLTLSCTNNDDDFEPKTITPVLIGKGDLSINTTLYTQQNIVITTNSEWRTLLTNFNSIQSNITSTFTETNIDFNKYQTIVVIEGGNSSTTTDITNIIENTNNITVIIQNLRKGLTQDVVFRFKIVKIPQSSKRVVFQ